MPQSARAQLWAVRLRPRVGLQAQELAQLLALRLPPVEPLAEIFEQQEPRHQWCFDRPIPLPSNNLRVPWQTLLASYDERH